jgi:hypothetical protein
MTSVDIGMFGDTFETLRTSSVKAAFYVDVTEEDLTKMKERQSWIRFHTLLPSVLDIS